MGAIKSFAQTTFEPMCGQTVCGQSLCACGTQKDQGCDAGEVRAYYEGRTKGIHYNNKCNSALDGDNAPLMQQLTIDRPREIESL